MIRKLDPDIGRWRYTVPTSEPANVDRRRSTPLETLNTCIGAT